MASRWQRARFVIAGLAFSVMWLGCWAATVVPGSPAVAMQWAGGNVLAALAVAAFGVASVARPDAVTSRLQRTRPAAALPGHTKALLGGPVRSALALVGYDR